MNRIILAILICSVSVLYASAHSGRTNAQGCHADTKNDSYHCHNKGITSDGASPLVSDTYNRNDWKHWIDEDGDGLDTRQEVLLAESTCPVIYSDSTHIISGCWYDPYTGSNVTHASELDIDHVVALKDAYNSNGYMWSKKKKQDFANDLDDPDHLIAVSKSANRSKGYKPPYMWLPSNKSYQCEYVLHYIAIKTKWNLVIDARTLDVKEKVCDAAQ